MEEPLPPPFGEDSPAEEMGLGARLANVFAAPGDVFADVRRSNPAVSNWLVPLVVWGLVGVIQVFVIFAQPAVQQQLREQQEKQLEKLVADGKIKAEDKEKALAAMEAMGLVAVKITGALGAVFGSAACLFGAALGLKVLGKLAWRADFSYAKAAEVTGLSAMILALGGVIQTLLVVINGNMFVTAGPALFLGNFDPANKAHQALGSLNVVTAWFVGVLAAGLATLANVSFRKAALWLAGFWVVLRTAVILGGWAAYGI